MLLFKLSMDQEDGIEQQCGLITVLCLNDLINSCECNVTIIGIRLFGRAENYTETFTLRTRDFEIEKILLN